LEECLHCQRIALAGYTLRDDFYQVFSKVCKRLFCVVFLISCDVVLGACGHCVRAVTTRDIRDILHSQSRLDGQSSKATVENHDFDSSIAVLKCGSNVFELKAGR
jgi:hypothetical protein